ncbi:hypothetical protein AB3X91_16220 [Paraburkholderia sp. BR14263]|uniref:tail completion protein gp17 n=1 Tax=unclassified Paraburkholderia TaxID=2615204 RepID=UPI0034CDDE6C
MNEAGLFSLLEPASPGRLFMILAPMEMREPYVVMSLISGTPQNTLCGSAHAWSMSYRIDSYARTRRDALETMEKIFELVDACNGDPWIESRSDIYEQDTRIHRVSVVLLTWYETAKVQP